MADDESSQQLENESTNPAGASSDSTEDPRTNTLNKLDTELRSYVPRDYLDEDEMINLISQMNDEDKQRQLTKEQLIQLDRLALTRDNRLKEVDSFPSSYNHSQFYEKFEITVDSEFFDSIVDSVSDKYFSKGSGQVMDDRELDELRESLGIMTYGPGKRNRKRKTFDRLSEDVPIDGDYDGKESSNRGKTFRRVTRNATMKRVQEQQRQVDTERMATLLEAMVEADKLAPLRRRYTAGEKKSMRDSKGMKRSRDSEYMSVDVNKRRKVQHAVDMNGNRKRYHTTSKHIRPATHLEKSSSRMDDPMSHGQNITPSRVDIVPTPRFLDWKRRLQLAVAERSLPEQISNKKINVVKPILTPSTIPLPALQGFESTIRSDPPRYRHSDIVYGTWCSQLIKYLNGPGRLFARYEFFYSDIDRAWFDHNPFQAEVLQMGLPLNIKLSRSEWSYVRRRMKNKPRRFSQHFVLAQMKSLETYRNTVRMIQRSPSDPSMIPSEFGYEVLTPIKTGSTVTAYNKRTKLLHRGVVLSIGPLDSNKYLIQFERKELGFEFCIDVEIASHGVKDVLLPANPQVMYGYHPGCNLLDSTTVGKLPYGTTYGTILNFNKDVTKRKLRNFYSGKGVARVVSDQDKAVEKEILIRLMFMMDSSLKRKARILKTITKLNRIIHSCEKRSHEKASILLNRPCNESFREHYKWLADSLVSTNYVIKSCLSYLQIMYGQAYSSGVQNTTSFHLADVCPHLNHAVGENEEDNNHSMIWANSLKAGYKDCGRLISDVIQAKEFIENDRSPRYASNASDEGCDETIPSSQDWYLDGCVSQACSLLLATELSRKSIWECRNEKIFSGSIIRSTLSEARDSLQPAPLKTDVPVHLNHITRARDLGFQALSEALSMLEGELDNLTSI